MFEMWMVVVGLIGMLMVEHERDDLEFWVTEGVLGHLRLRFYEEGSVQ